MTLDYSTVHQVYCEKLNTKHAVDFHHLVEKILFLPIVPGWTPALQFHSSPQEWENLTMTIGEICTYNEIYQRHKEATTYPEFQRKLHTKMVGWWIILVASKHERAHLLWPINGKSIYHFQSNKIEAEHAEFHSNWNFRCRTMYQLLVRRSGVWYF